MPDPSTLFAFAAVALGMVLTPGPNMIYLVSRSLVQGPRAGLVSLGAGRISAIFTGRPLWLRAQRWLMATVLGALAVRLALEHRR